MAKDNAKLLIKVNDDTLEVDMKGDEDVIAHALSATLIKSVEFQKIFRHAMVHWFEHDTGRDGSDLIDSIKNGEDSDLSILKDVLGRNTKKKQKERIVN